MLLDLFLSFLNLLLLCVLTTLIVIAMDVRLESGREEKSDVATFAFIVELRSSFQIYR